MNGNEPGFRTDRLDVSEWHEATRTLGSEVSLLEIVRAFLTPDVTSRLPSGWPGEFSDRRARDWIADRDAEGTTLLASSRDTGQPVGLVLLYESLGAAELPELRLGYLIEESQWGRGFASEMVKGVVAWARSASFGSIVAGVSSDNVPSQRVLEKSGFVRMSDESEEPSEVFYRIDL